MERRRPGGGARYRRRTEPIQMDDGNSGPAQYNSGLAAIAQGIVLSTTLHAMVPDGNRTPSGSSGRNVCTAGRTRVALHLSAM